MEGGGVWWSRIILGYVLVCSPFSVSFSCCDSAKSQPMGRVSGVRRRGVTVTAIVGDLEKFLHRCIALVSQYFIHMSIGLVSVLVVFALRSSRVVAGG
jgi:hypothetical protein